MNRCPQQRLSLPLLAALSLFVATPAAAQKVIPPAKAQPSPLQVAAKKLDPQTYVKITYSSPRRRDPKTDKDREIFGKLVPYGQVWRLGANAATELTTTGDLELAGKRLPAGTYALFAIPQADKWTLIVNRELGQWGAHAYKQESDVLRVDLPVKKSTDIHEAFTITLDEKAGTLGFAWDNVQLSAPLRPAQAFFAGRPGRPGAHARAPRARAARAAAACPAGARPRPRP